MLNDVPPDYYCNLDQSGKRDRKVQPVMFSSVFSFAKEPYKRDLYSAEETYNFIGLYPFTATWTNQAREIEKKTDN